MNKQTNKQTNNNNKGTTPVPQGGQVFYLFININFILFFLRVFAVYFMSCFFVCFLSCNNKLWGNVLYDVWYMFLLIALGI